MVAVTPQLVIMFFAIQMHQIELIHQAHFLKQLKRAVDRCTINPGIFFACQPEQ